MTTLTGCLTVMLGLTAATVLGDQIITGVGTSTSWDSHDYNAIAQWRVSGTGAATTVTRLGRVRLGPNSKLPAEGGGIFGYGCGTRDVAMLKDGRVAVLHANSTLNGYQISVFTLQYDGGGLLTGATLDVTVNTTMDYVGGVFIAPTGDGGFVVSGIYQGLGNYKLFFFAPSAGTFVQTSKTIASYMRGDGAGTIATRPEVVYQMYQTTTPVPSYRYGYDGAVYKTLARYSDFQGISGDVCYMDGLRNPLTPNGWVIQNYNGSGATVCNDATVDGSTNTCIKGHFYESNGTTPFTTAADRVAGLADGRVAMLASPTANNNQRDIFYIFDLTSQGLPGGETVGAVGYKAVTNNYSTKGMASYGVRIVGDYQVPPAIPKGTMVLIQ